MGKQPDRCDGADDCANDAHHGASDVDDPLEPGDLRRKKLEEDERRRGQGGAGGAVPTGRNS